MPLLLPAKRSEATGEESLRGGSDEEDGGCGIDGSRKKLRLSKDQSAVLEDSFREHPTLNPVRPCLDDIKVLSFFTLSPSHQFLDACMKH